MGRWRLRGSLEGVEIQQASLECMLWRSRELMYELEVYIQVGCGIVGTVQESDG